MATENAPANVVSNWQIYFLSSLLSIAICTGSMCSSIQAPIYPQEAEAKEVPPSQYGFVFGVFQLVIVISSPIYGAYANAIGVKFMFNAGTFISAWCIILFGFLHFSPPGVTFLSLSIAIRAFGALGDSAIYTSGFILATALHPKAMATIVAVLEASYTAGMIIGPTVGSCLYQVGGFSLPFFVIGGLLMFMCLIAMFSLRRANTTNSDTVKATEDTPKYRRLIRNASFVITLFSVFAVSGSLGFVQALLEPHLTTLNLSESEIGLVFMALGVAYAISSVGCGRIADKIGYFKVMIAVGLSASILSLLFLGPAPFVPFQMTIASVVTSLIACGAGVGCVYINCYMELLDVIAGDGAKTVAIQGFVSGLYTCFIALGCFFGPTLGGPLNDLIGFPLASMAVLALELIAVILVIGIMVKDEVQKRHTWTLPRVS